MSNNDLWSQDSWDALFDLRDHGLTTEQILRVRKKAELLSQEREVEAISPVMVADALTELVKKGDIKKNSTKTTIDMDREDVIKQLHEARDHINAAVQFISLKLSEDEARDHIISLEVTRNIIMLLRDSIEENG